MTLSLWAKSRAWVVVKRSAPREAHSTILGLSVVDPLSIAVLADEAALRDHANHADQEG